MGNQHNLKKEASKIPGPWFGEHILFDSTGELTSSSSIIQKCKTNLLKTHTMRNMSFKQTNKKQKKKLGDLETS